VLLAADFRQPQESGGWLARTAAILGIAREGMPAICALVILAIFSALFGWHGLTAFFFIIAAAVGLFFRDPQRQPPAYANAIVSAADGRVIEVHRATLPTRQEQSFIRIAVFLSLLDVHVNRAPVEGQIVAIEHTPGIFKAGFSDKAALYNERNLLLLRDHAGRLYAVIQIAGYLARRIICTVRPEQWVSKGERIGMIMFGSRVDHYLPLDCRVTVRVGDRVRGGETIIAELRQ
jgi:phosphatidylserine decarboxylase